LRRAEADGDELCVLGLVFLGGGVLSWRCGGDKSVPEKKSSFAIFFLPARNLLFPRPQHPNNKRAAPHRHAGVGQRANRAPPQLVRQLEGGQVAKVRQKHNGGARAGLGLFVFLF
jgi:hypothetical protein